MNSDINLYDLDVCEMNNNSSYYYVWLFYKNLDKATYVNMITKSYFKGNFVSKVATPICAETTMGNPTVVVFTYVIFMKFRLSL